MWNGGFIQLSFFLSKIACGNCVRQSTCHGVDFINKKNRNIEAEIIKVL